MNTPQHDEGPHVVTCLYLDLREQDFSGGILHARQTAEDIPVAPAMLMENDDGYSLAWKLKEPLDLGQRDDENTFSSYCNALTSVFGGEAIGGLYEEWGLHNIDDSFTALQPIIYNPDQQCNLSDFDAIIPLNQSHVSEHCPLEFEKRCQGVRDFFDVVIGAHREVIQEHGGPYSEIRVLEDPKSTKSTIWHPIKGNHTFEELQALVPEILQHSDADENGECTPFISVNPRSSRSGRSIEDVICVSTLHVEIDTGEGKPFKNPEEALEFVHTRHFKPCRINRTKKSLHLYFPLKQPFFTTNEKERDIAKGALELLCREFKGDRNCNEISRVLRIPFTWHRKDLFDPFLVHPIPCPDAPAYSVEEIYEVLDNPEKATWGSRTSLPTKTSKLQRGTVRKDLSPGYQHLLDEFPGPDGTGANEKSFFLYRAMIECGWPDEEIYAAFEDRIVIYPDQARRQQWLKKLPIRLKGLNKDLNTGKLKIRVPADFKHGRLVKTDTRSPCSNVNLLPPQEDKVLWQESDNAIDMALRHNGPAIISEPPGSGKTRQSVKHGLGRKRVLFCFENIDRIQECYEGGMLDVACSETGISKNSVKVILGRQEPDCQDAFREPFICYLTEKQRHFYWQMGYSNSDVCSFCHYRAACPYLEHSVLPKSGLVLTTRAKYLNDPMVRKWAKCVFVDESLLPYFFDIKHLELEYLQKYRDAIASSNSHRDVIDLLLIIIDGMNPLGFQETKFMKHLRTHLGKTGIGTLDNHKGAPWEKNGCPRITHILISMALGLINQKGVRVQINKSNGFDVKFPAPIKELNRIISLDSTPVVPREVCDAYNIKIFGSPCCLPDNVEIHGVSEHIGILEEDADPQIIETATAFLDDPNHCAMLRKLHEDSLLKSRPDLRDRIGHYGLDERGTNKFKTMEAIYLDRYQTNISAIQERARDFHALLKRAKVPVDTLNTDIEYRNSSLPGTDWVYSRVPFFTDPFLQEVHRLDRDAFYFQALHRLRPMSRPGEKIQVFIADARPVEALRYDSVSTREVFADSLGIKLTKRPDRAALDKQNTDRMGKAEMRREKLNKLLVRPDGTISSISRERAMALSTELGCSISTLRADIKQLTLLQNGP